MSFTISAHAAGQAEKAAFAAVCFALWLPFFKVPPDKEREMILTWKDLDILSKMKSF